MPPTESGSPGPAVRKPIGRPPGDVRRACADATHERHWQQEPEHREARHRLHDVCTSDNRRRDAWPPRRENAERHAERHRHERGRRDEQYVLAEQCRLLRERRVGQQPAEKLVAGVGDGTQNGRSNPGVCGIAPGDGGEGISGALAD